ncbi:hypothetical protein FS837_002003 [Tulasnella sp. UAMH 9824]|nr:hypothetical protein FS837_002003 [Tulasnella sp. UAMH 9824]
MMDSSKSEEILSEELEACLHSAEKSAMSKSGTVHPTIFLKFLIIWDLIKDYIEDMRKRDNREYHQLETGFTRLKAAVLAAQRHSNADINPADPSPNLPANAENDPKGHLVHEEDF